MGRCTSRRGGVYHATHEPRARQEFEIKQGALWPYVNELKVYRCPLGLREELLTYAISIGMNGGPAKGTCDLVNGRPVPRQEDGMWLWLKRLGQIGRPAERMVFIDEGWITVGPYAVRYWYRTWWDGPPFQHADGTTMTFADGHVEYWKWKGLDTIKIGRRARDVKATHVRHNWVPETEDGFQDLWRVQRATWGKLGYDPVMW